MRDRHGEPGRVLIVAWRGTGRGENASCAGVLAGKESQVDATKRRNLAGKRICERGRIGSIGRRERARVSVKPKKWQRTRAAVGEWGRRSASYMTCGGLGSRKANATRFKAG